MEDFLKEGLKSQSWVWKEARKVLDRVEAVGKDLVTFQTGFGPSGLPHIGTFGEVLRTTMVMKAFECLSPGRKARLIVFSDDMDGMRKVPENLPNQALLQKNIGIPLSRVPDPYGKCESFAHRNNSKLVEFLDFFGFKYEFRCSSDLYGSGFFDDFLVQVLESYDPILKLLLPTLGKERRENYSPFMPICPKTNKVLQVKVERENGGVISYVGDNGEKVQMKATGGNCKLQWKVDWAMRWLALGVDYEMCGKDLRDSFALSSKVCKVLGGKPPEGLIYEMFLDEDGGKISKSRGNGLEVDEWLRYAPKESMSFYMYQSPSSAKRLCFDAIPRAMDNYLTALANYSKQDLKMRLGNPVWHIHSGQPPKHPGVDFSLLLNVASTCNAENEAILWGFVERYKDVDRRSDLLGEMVQGALNYYRDRIVPNKKYKVLKGEDRQALIDLRDSLLSLGKDAEEEEVQGVFYEVGKRHHYPDLKTWFEMLYRVLIGQEAGPRWAPFVSFYGLDNLVQLMDEKIGSS